MFVQSFVRVDVNILSKNCSYRRLGELGMKRYLHILLHTDSVKGYTITGYRSFIKQVKYTSRQSYKDIESSLVALGFITQNKLAQKITATYPLNVPFECSNNVELIKHSSFVINNHCMQKHRQDYILVPSNAIEKALRMEFNMMLVYLKLYRYNSYITFRGIDINAVHIKNEKLWVHRRITHDLCMSQEEVRGYIHQLLRIGLIKAAPVALKVYRYGIFRVKIPAMFGASKNLKQLRPYYQFKRKERD